MRIALAAVVLFSILTSSASAQMWGNAEYLYFARLSGSSTPLVTGPNSLSTIDNNGGSSGYRFTIGGYIGQLEIEASFMNVEGMSSSSGGTLTSALSLDDQFANTNVFPGGPVNRFAIPTGLYQAATYGGVGGLGSEATEAEFLQPGATYVQESFTDLKSGEINFSTNRNLNPWRVGVGYRTFIIKDGSSSLFSGNFDAIDIGGGTANPNDGLSDQAMVAAGFQNVAGTGDGFDSQLSPNGPDTMRILNNGYARNELHGAQLVGAYQLFPLDWLTIELLGKAGLFYNTMQGSVTETVAGGGNDDSVYTRTLSGKKHSAAFAGTLGARGIVPITDYINITVGYEAMFFSGIGLGARQLDGVETNIAGSQFFDPRSGSHLIVHGGTVGLQLTW